jgi:hypothetical protein
VLNSIEAPTTEKKKTGRKQNGPRKRKMQPARAPFQATTGAAITITTGVLQTGDSRL